MSSFVPTMSDIVTRFKFDTLGENIGAGVEHHFDAEDGMYMGLVLSDKPYKQYVEDGGTLIHDDVSIKIDGKVLPKSLYIMTDGFNGNYWQTYIVFTPALTNEHGKLLTIEFLY